MIYLKMGNFDEVALSEVSSKKLYEAFRNKKQVPPTAQTRLKEKFPHFSVDWKEIYSLPFTVTIETKIREFQYKIFNVEKDFDILNHLVLAAKLYIYNCNLNNVNP